MAKTWINVKDRLPKNNHDVIAYNGFVGIGYYDCERWSIDAHQNHEVTHWQTLPPPPKE